MLISKSGVGPFNGDVEGSGGASGGGGWVVPADEADENPYSGGGISGDGLGSYYDPRATGGRVGPMATGDAGGDSMSVVPTLTGSVPNSTPINAASATATPSAPTTAGNGSGVSTQNIVAALGGAGSAGAGDSTASSASTPDVHSTIWYGAEGPTSAHSPAPTASSAFNGPGNYCVVLPDGTASDAATGALLPTGNPVQDALNWRLQLSQGIANYQPGPTMSAAPPAIRQQLADEKAQQDALRIQAMLNSPFGSMAWLSAYTAGASPQGQDVALGLGQVAEGVALSWAGARAGATTEFLGAQTGASLFPDPAAGTELPASGTVQAEKEPLQGLTPAERKIFQELEDAGNFVETVPRADVPTPDFLVNGIPTELKTLTSAGANTLKNAIEKATGQGLNIIIDARNVAISAQGALQQILRAQGNVGSLQGRVVVFTREGPVKY